MMKWKCHAKPAALNGQTCGHLNKNGLKKHFLGNPLTCCEKCGCTKIASDARKEKEHVSK